MDPAVQMVEDLATKIPGFDGAINMSWDQDYGVSPHLALSIITDETVESFVRDDGEPPDWRAVLPSWRSRAPGTSRPSTR
jgi:hypothetical protein